MVFFEIMIIVYLFVFIFGVFAGGLAIALEENVYNMDEVLNNPFEAFLCVFQWQAFVLFTSRQYINLFGSTLLVIITTFLFFPFNILVFAIIVFLLFIKAICLGFLWVFKK